MKTEGQATHILVAGTAVWRRREVDGHLIASCPSLRILVWGKTEKELEGKQHRAVILTLLYLHGQGILSSFLEERGFSVEVTEGSTLHLPSAGPSAGDTPIQPPRGPHVHPFLQYDYA